MQYDQNLIARGNTNFVEIKTLFDITLSMIVDQPFDILNLLAVMYAFSSWRRSSLCHDHMGESKGTCPLRFSFVSGKDA